MKKQLILTISIISFLAINNQTFSSSNGGMVRLENEKKENSKQYDILRNKNELAYQAAHVANQASHAACQAAERATTNIPIAAQLAERDGMAANEMAQVAHAANRNANIAIENFHKLFLNYSVGRVEKVAVTEALEIAEREVGKAVAITRETNLAAKKANQTAKKTTSAIDTAIKKVAAEKTASERAIAELAIKAVEAKLLADKKGLDINETGKRIELKVIEQSERKAIQIAEATAKTGIETAEKENSERVVTYKTKRNKLIITSGKLLLVLIGLIGLGHRYDCIGKIKRAVIKAKDRAICTFQKTILFKKYFNFSH